VVTILENIVRDDRDHRGFRLPTSDTLGGYDFGKYRPVYFVTGKSQGLSKYKKSHDGRFVNGSKILVFVCVGCFHF